MILYPGYDAYPVCGTCLGTGQPMFTEAGAVSLTRTPCFNCGGNGHEPERRPVVRDRNGITWIVTDSPSNPTEGTTKP